MKKHLLLRSFFTGIKVIPFLFSVILAKGQTTMIPADPWQTEPRLSKQLSDNYITFTYTDGTAENYCAWLLAGNMNAVKFSLSTYPASIVGASIYVGGGSFPVGGSILNQPFRVSVYDSDGENGLPGTLIDSISAVVTNYEWVFITGLHALVTRDVYIAITQLSGAPDCIPIGVDETLPKVNQSYSRNVLTGSPWVLSPYQDLMINVLISTNVGLDDPKAPKLISLSPNPANETVTLEFPAEMESLLIMNANGQNIFKTDLINQSTIYINTSHYLSGIYYIRFIDAKGDSFIRKLVVVH